MNPMHNFTKPIVATVAALITLAGIAHAEPLFSLWADEQMTTCEVSTVGPYSPFNVYMFIEPPDEGVISAEFRMAFPEEHFSTSFYHSPVVSDSSSGDWFGSPGIKVDFISCQTDLFWIACYTMMSPNTTPAGYWIYPHGETQFLGFETCSDPGVRVNARLYTCVTLNDSCWNCGDYYVDPTAVSHSSWGAIKSMMKE